MIEIRRECHEHLLPVGSIRWEAERVTPKFALYDIYENEDTDEFVEIWVPLKELPKDG